MTNNINQQKFNVLLKHPKDQVKIMTQIHRFLSISGGRKTIWFLTKRKKCQLRTFRPGSNNTSPAVGLMLLLRLLVFRRGGNIVNNGVTSPQSSTRQSLWLSVGHKYCVGNDMKPNTFKARLFIFDWNGIACLESGKHINFVVAIRCNYFSVLQYFVNSFAGYWGVISDER